MTDVILISYSEDNINFGLVGAIGGLAKAGIKAGVSTIASKAPTVANNIKKAVTPSNIANKAKSAVNTVKTKVATTATNLENKATAATNKLNNTNQNNINNINQA
jgi:hypothetical protein